MDKVWKKKIVLTCHALFSLWDFLTFEGGNIRLSRNVGKELPLYAV